MNIFQRSDDTNNEDDKLQYNKTYDLTEALPLEHYEENYSEINVDDEHSSTHHLSLQPIQIIYKKYIQLEREDIQRYRIDSTP